jgi:hypothetical protein
VLLALACLGGCARTAATASVAPSAGEEVAAAAERPVPEPDGPTGRAPSCAAAEPTGRAPSILVATWPETPRRRVRDARGRPVIELDGFDSGYGPLRVARIDARGLATDLGEGSDPRLHEGAILYRESTDDRSTTVRILPDGAVERREGGTGRLPSFDGPAPWWQMPFTRDGRFMAFAGCDDDGLGCALVVYDHFPVAEDDAPLESVDLIPPIRPSDVLLTEDARVVAACTREDGSDRVGMLWVDRVSAERRTLRVPGRCRALSPSGDRVLVSDHETAQAWAVTPASGERTPIDVGLRVSAAAFDRCGSSVVVVGAVPDAGVQRAVRWFFDGRAPLVLFETSGSPELLRVEVDERGWALAASDDPGHAAHVLVVSLGGGPPAEWTVPGRVFDTALGP